MPKKKAAQLELFAAAGEVHQLGLLGWEDALWTKPIQISLIGGQTLTVNLETIRRLRKVARQLEAAQIAAMTLTPCATAKKP
jgi:hypothetical protein